MKRLSDRLALIFVVVLLASTVGFTTVKRSSDGPLTDMIPGGRLVAGRLVEVFPTNWDDELEPVRGCRGIECNANVLAELQLVEPVSSRYTGIMVHDGELYVPCDLGFMWNRFEGHQRFMLRLIYWFKTWHEHAELDGRAVIRIDGTRYEGALERVTDESLDEALRVQLETMAATWLAPETLGPRPAEAPNDIWFFRFYSSRGDPPGPP